MNLSSNPEHNFLRSIKQFPSLIFGLNQNVISSEAYSLLKIQILRIEITHNLKIPDFNPYISVKIANESKKTMTNSQRDPYNAVFNECFEFKMVPIKNHLVITLNHKSAFLFADKYLGHSSISLDNPLLTNFRKLTLLNENEKNDKLIGYLYIKISIEGENKPNNEQKGLNQKNKPFVSKEIDDNMNNFRSKEKANKNINENSDKFNIRRKEETTHRFNNNSNSNINQLNIKEIERIYFELNQEKKKIKLQEKKIKKFNALLKRKELQIEEEKVKIQKKKNLLTEEENSLVSDKEKCKERIKMINKEKEVYIENQNQIKQEISRYESTNIKHKLRGVILLKKLNDQTKYMNEINDQIYQSSESIHQITEKLSYVTMSYIDPGNLGNDDEVPYKKIEEKKVKKMRRSNSLEIEGGGFKQEWVGGRDERRMWVQMVREEKKKQEILVEELNYSLNEEKRVFENYQKFLKICTPYITNPNTPYTIPFANTGKNEVNAYSFSNVCNNAVYDDKNTINIKDYAFEKEKALAYEMNKVKENKFYKGENGLLFDDFNKTSTFFNFDQYAQPFALSPGSQEIAYNKSNRTYGSSVSKESINSSQLFNDYFIKNNLNK